MAEINTKSRGRKQCPQCKKFIGVRTIICACGLDFSSAPKKPKVNKSDFDFKIYNNSVVIDTPSGKCPAVLYGTDDVSIATWVNRLLEIGIEYNRFYTAKAVKYFVRQFYDIDSEDYMKVLNLIDKHTVLQEIE